MVYLAIERSTVELKPVRRYLRYETSHDPNYSLPQLVIGDTCAIPEHTYRSIRDELRNRINSIAYLLESGEKPLDLESKYFVPKI